MSARNFDGLEHAVLTLIEETPTVHPITVEWKRRVLDSPTYADPIPTPEHLYDTETLAEFHREGWDYDRWGELKYPRIITRWDQLLDRSVFMLISDLVNHRLGREGVDLSRSITRFMDQIQNAHDGDVEAQIEDLVGVAEIAEKLGWDKRRVSVYVARGVFPPPVNRLAMGQIWRWRDVERVAIDRGWLPGPLTLAELALPKLNRLLGADDEPFDVSDLETVDQEATERLDPKVQERIKVFKDGSIAELTEHGVWRVRPQNQEE